MFVGEFEKWCLEFSFCRISWWSADSETGNLFREDKTPVTTAAPFLGAARFQTIYAGNDCLPFLLRNRCERFFGYFQSDLANVMGLGIFEFSDYSTDT